MFEFLPQWLRNLIIAALALAAFFMTVGAFREGMIDDTNIIKGLTFWWGLPLVAFAGDNIKRDAPWTGGKIFLTVIGAIGGLGIVLGLT